MAYTNDGGPAFPTGCTTVDNNGVPLRPNELEPLSGMSLRDWLAGQALAGYLAQNAGMSIGTTNAASSAYAFADAMLAERAK